MGIQKESRPCGRLPFSAMRLYRVLSHRAADSGRYGRRGLLLRRLVGLVGDAVQHHLARRGLRGRRGFRLRRRGLFRSDGDGRADHDARPALAGRAGLGMGRYGDGAGGTGTGGGAEGASLCENGKRRGTLPAAPAWPVPQWKAPQQAALEIPAWMLPPAQTVSQRKALHQPAPIRAAARAVPQRAGRRARARRRRWREAVWAAACRLPAPAETARGREDPHKSPQRRGWLWFPAASRPTSRHHLPAIRVWVRTPGGCKVKPFCGGQNVGAAGSKGCPFPPPSSRCRTRALHSNGAARRSSRH